MRTETKNWFEVKVAWEKALGDGCVKKTTELYVVDALSFTEAERRCIFFLEPYAGGDLEIRAITPAKYNTILLSDTVSDNKYFRVVLGYITMDENTGKEKRLKESFLVQSQGFFGCKVLIQEFMADLLIDYDIIGVTETAVVDIVLNATAGNDQHE